MIERIIFIVSLIVVFIATAFLQGCDECAGSPSCVRQRDQDRETVRRLERREVDRELGRR